MSARFIFAWYDCWVGLFWDATKRRLYVFPLPMIGFWVEWNVKCSDCKTPLLPSKSFEYCGRPHCHACWKDNRNFDADCS